MTNDQDLSLQTLKTSLFNVSHFYFLYDIQFNVTVYSHIRLERRMIRVELEDRCMLYTQFKVFSI